MPIAKTFGLGRDAISTRIFTIAFHLTFVSAQFRGESCRGPGFIYLPCMA